ncbi:MAG: hypothetical protein NTY45_04210 [Elusimicrobia bacterium]|nr:hypothetical protein [Elusimicrobiota bacterium]
MPDKYRFFHKTGLYPGTYAQIIKYQNAYSRSVLFSLLITQVITVAPLVLAAGSGDTFEESLSVNVRDISVPPASALAPIPAPTAVPAGAPAGKNLELRNISEMLDPAGHHYPKGMEQARREETRIRGAAANKEPALPDQYRQVLEEIRAMGVSYTDLFHGSHMIIRDEGAHYERWRLLHAFPRISSHYRNVKTQQYELRLKNIGGLLFGKTSDENTWFQMEAHTSAPENALLHVGDYMKYKLGGGVNIGPMGESPRTDQSPIFLDPPQR